MTGTLLPDHLITYTRPPPRKQIPPTTQPGEESIRATMTNIGGESEGVGRGVGRRGGSAGPHALPITMIRSVENGPENTESRLRATQRKSPVVI